MNKLLFNVKNLVFLSVLLMSLYATDSAAFAAGVEISSQGKSITVALNQYHGKYTVCKIIDSEGKVVYHEKIEGSSQNMKKYDLNSLPAGAYMFVIEDEMSLEKISLQLSETEIIGMDKARPIYKPTYSKESEDKIYLNMLARNKEVTVTVSKEGQELFFRSYEGEPSIQEVIDFSQAEQGDYVIKLTMLGEVFYENITI